MTEAEVVDLATTVLAVALLVEFIAAIIASIYIARIYVKSDRGSRVFRMLVRADAIKVVAAGWIGGLAVYRLIKYPTALPIWTAPISAVVVMVLLSPPIYHAYTFWSVRHGRGDGSPPPFNPDD